MLVIHSTTSDRELRIEKRASDWYIVTLSGIAVSAKLDMWDAPYGARLIEFFDKLGSRVLPWSGDIDWCSFEGEFAISASCTSSGHVIFRVSLQGSPGGQEEWQISAGITAELGQLPSIASQAHALILG